MISAFLIINTLGEMDIVSFLLVASCYLFAAMAFITLLPFDHWVVRDFDFPKVQLLTLSVLLLFLAIIFLNLTNVFVLVALIVLLLGILFHFYRIIPFTSLYPKEVEDSRLAEENDFISIMASNVLMKNNNYKALIDLVQRKQPDLLLTLETDIKWEKALSVLDSDYPYSQKIPKNNLYGMHFYSKLPIKDMEVRYLFDEDVPSIHCRLQLRNKKWISVYGLHPKPPSPTEAAKSTKRDAELLKVGREVQQNNTPTLVFGDLNDVAWSRTTLLFRKISGLMDPRIGRGRYCTFHTAYPMMRWPLDHLFHSKDFFISELKVLPTIGSDHFPIYAKLQLSTMAERKQTAPKSDQEEIALAKEKIKKGQEQTQ